MSKIVPVHKHLNLNQLTALAESSDESRDTAQSIYRRDYARKDVVVKCVKGKIIDVQLDGIKEKPYNFEAFVSNFSVCFTKKVTLEGFHFSDTQNPFKATEVILKSCKFTFKIRKLRRMFPKVHTLTLDGTCFRGEYNADYRLKYLTNLTIIMAKWMCKKVPVRAISKFLAQNRTIRSLIMLKHARWCHVQVAVKYLKLIRYCDYEFGTSKQPFYKFNYPYDRLFEPDSQRVQCHGLNDYSYIE